MAVTGRTVGWQPLLSLEAAVGDLFGPRDASAARDDGAVRVDYGAIQRQMVEEYRGIVPPRSLGLLAKKATSIYEFTAPHAAPEIADALCRLSFEWWILNSVLDYKCESSLPLDDCRQLLLEAAMMFWDTEYQLPRGGTIHPLQRGFHATAQLCWARTGESKLWVQTIASELIRYVFSRNIGVEKRNDTFDSVEGALKGRRDDGGMVAQVLLTELVEPLSLSEATRRSAAYAEALERMSTVTCLLNDIASVKDDHESGALNVCLFLYEQECMVADDQDEAMRKALEGTCDVLRREQARFVAALGEIEALQTDPPQVLLAYTSFLRVFIDSYWRWQLSCSAYFDPDHPVVEMRR